MTSRPSVAPGRGTTWRPLTKRERTSDCAAVGLLLGDCSGSSIEDSAYCFYHTKVEQELITYFEANTEHGLAQVAPQHYYPVFPLPKAGYVLLYEEEAA